MSWTTAKYIADSKIVRSSYFWLIVVPITAKLFEKTAPNVTINLFGQPFKLVLKLPFSWEILFYAALLFSLGNIIYTLRCPPIIRMYKHFSDFKEKGNTLLKIHREVHSMVVDKSNKLKTDFVDIANQYIEKYANGGMYRRFDDESDSVYYDVDKSFYDTNHANKQDAPQEAFQFAQEIGDSQNSLSKWITLILYSFGLALMGVIVCENIIFVIKHSSIIP